MSEWEDQSLRDFVSSLGDTAVDLEPIGQKIHEEQEQAEAEEAAKAKKKRIILISGIVVLVLAIIVGTALWLSHRGSLSDEYEAARTEYEQLREEALDKLEDAEMLAEECRVSIDNTSDCDDLDAAIVDVEEKSLEIPVASPSATEVEKLKKATEDLHKSLEELDSIYTRVEEEMGESAGVHLQELIDEAEQSSASAHALLSQSQGALDNASDANELKTLVERLDSTIETAQSLLTDNSSGTLVSGTKPTEARDVAKSLRRLIDDVADASDTVRQSHQNFLNNQAQQSQSNESNAPAPAPSPTASDASTTNENSEDTGDNSGDNSQSSNNGSGN